MNLSNMTVRVAKAIILLTALSVLSSCVENTAKTSSSKQFAPLFGVCISVENYPKVDANGYSYIEESVGGYLVPLNDERVFLANLSKSEALGAKVYSCNGFLPSSLKSTGPNTKHDEILEYSETAFRRAQMVGIKVIVFGSGRSRSTPSGFTHKEATDRLVALLKRMGPIAQKYDITVVMEPLNKKECNILNSVAEGLDIVKRVDHPNIMLLADIYHMAMDNEPVENIIKAGKYLHHIHIAEKVDRRSPGTSRYDFTPHFASLKKIGYKGRISVECRWKDFNNELPIAMDYLKEQIEAVN